MTLASFVAASPISSVGIRGRLMDIEGRVNEVQRAWDAYLASDRAADCLGRVCQTVDALLGEVLGSSPTSPDPQDIKALLTRTRTSERSFKALLKVTPEDLVPILVMREIMRRRQIDFDPRQVSNWSEFIRRYGDAIILIAGEH